ncbi:MAG: YggT family protein [Alphaproteobacteria bacterium]|nr:YggT family protein [Alphaproteobacteria bacterium]
MIPTPVFMLIDAILQLYQFAVFIMVIMSWLLSFNVINRHNQFVDAIWRALVAVTEPLLAPIRRVMPNLGGLDLSPVVLLLGVYFAREMNRWLMLRIGLN